MAKPARLLNDDQLPLASSAFGPAINAVHAGGGKRIRALLNQAITANGMSLVTLAEETGIDEKQIGRSLRDDGGAHPPLPLVACILSKDRLGIVVQGIAALVGWEAVKAEPDPARENAKLREELGRLRSEIDRLLDGGQP